MGLRTWLKIKKSAEERQRDGALQRNGALERQRNGALAVKAQREILDMLAMLRPHRAIGYGKARVGAQHDGGYVMLDDFQGIELAISCGIGRDCSFDLTIAEKAIPVVQFDHTIDKPPSAHHLFEFHKLAISPKEQQDGITIDKVLERASTAANAVMKMDIEGSEWHSLGAVDPASLSRVAQLVIEFHDLHLASDASTRSLYSSVFAKLASHFQCVHVHGNNYAEFVNLFGISIPQTLEITFANRSRYQFVPSDEIFPTPLDRPNASYLPDLRLGTFVF